jgi:hypothetical protein
MIGDTRWSVRINQIRWDELSEGRREFKPGGVNTASVDALLSFQWTERRTHLPAFWHQPTALLSLADPASTVTISVPGNGARIDPATYVSHLDRLPDRTIANLASAEAVSEFTNLF